MTSYVLGFQEIDQTQVAIVGGKGAHLGELSRIEGVRVPPGFCVTTDAFRRSLAGAPPLEERLERLARLAPDHREAVRALGEELQRILEAIAIPDEVAAAITAAYARLGERVPCAVRSSATAEDSPTASFAGQQDTYLNVVGEAAILRRVSRCWGSLFTERAVTYRLRNGFDSRKVHMAVVVQQMVFPEVAGILFTADPVTGNRKVSSVEASFGLGEALVSGLVNADVYQVRDGEVIARAIATKRLAIQASPTGGTRRQAIDPPRQQQPSLSDAQAVQLAQLGRRIEAHFGCPQDIEWCLTDDGGGGDGDGGDGGGGDVFHIVQSRPITTLFPVPAAGDGENHVYLSVGHQQMMTDAMRPLGLSLFQLTAAKPMYEAGGRLFVDVTGALASPASRAGLLKMMERLEPLTGDALRTLLGRGDFLRSLPDEGPGGAAAGGAAAGGAAAGGVPAGLDADPAIVVELIEGCQASLAALKRDIQMKSGPALFDFILADLQELKRILFDPRSSQVFMSAMEATWWLNEQLQAWLGEKNAADTLAQSVPHNVTSEMGLALLEVADVIRPYPDVVAFLQRVADEGKNDGDGDVDGDGEDEGENAGAAEGEHERAGERFLDELGKRAGGREARAAIEAYLDRYGMRCVGEIDLTRPRFHERPTALVPMLLGNLKNFEPGAGARRFEHGRQEAWKKEQELLGRLRALPGGDGERKAQEVKRMIDRVRTFIGYREYPKYGKVSRTFVYKQALMKEAARLVQARVLREKEDIFYLTFQELHEVARTGQADDELIRRRKDAFRSYRALTPPRVITSEGEVIAGAYRRDDVPGGALVGLAVSAGTVEGRARVILDVAEAELEAGDILVTAFTDPSWTPLFVAIKGLVTEVGGLMTHGAVIAREYGLPAIVGVEHATRLIRDGQRIRVHGTEGYVELLPEPDGAAPASAG